jgi:mannosyltransferase OCH1-like enzyme
MSIPKTIHYVWIGGKENIPAKDQEYIAGWRKLNPDFRIRIWDEKAIDLKKYGELFFIDTVFDFSHNNFRGKKW